MPFQLRHDEYGLYQGVLLGFSFWYPSSGMPEQGVFEFSNYDTVAAFVEFLTSKSCANPINPTKLHIESFDYELDGKLVNQSPL